MEHEDDENDLPAGWELALFLHDCKLEEWFRNNPDATLLDILVAREATKH